MWGGAYEKTKGSASQRRLTGAALLDDVHRQYDCLSGADCTTRGRNCNCEGAGGSAAHQETFFGGWNSGSAHANAEAEQWIRYKTKKAGLISQTGLF